MNAEVRTMKTAAELSLADAYAAAKGRLPGIAALRETAFRKFEDRRSFRTGASRSGNIPISAR